MGGGSSLNLLSTVKLFWLAKNKNVIHIYKIHTSLVFIATMTSLQLLLLFFALHKARTKRGKLKAMSAMMMFKSHRMELPLNVKVK